MILALYLRLSKEDGDMADESNSITNQRLLLHRFVEERSEFDGCEVKEYIDDGFSGKNFARPGIQKLLADVKSGKVLCIIVKDFSRFGRNHIEVGDYIEKIFPLLDVRFIAVNNSFDSIDHVGTTPGMDVTFENLMYDYFSEENSIKIKNDLMGRRTRGNYLATFAPFGYQKSPSTHNRIVVDEEAAVIVRLIFEKYVEFGKKAEVARYLNAHGIPTPQTYMMSKNNAYQWKYQEEKKVWNGSIVGRILKNRIYTGDMVFHKKEIVEVGSKKTKCLPKSQWNICEGTHEPIISKELFDLVGGISQARQAESVKRDEKRKRGSADSPVKGLVKCGGCRHAMVRRCRLNVSYYCRHYYETKLRGCCPGNVKEKELMEVVLSAIRHQVALMGESEKLRELYCGQLNQKRKENQKQSSLLQNNLKKLTDDNFSLYESYAKGEITADEFMRRKEINNAEIEHCKQKLQAGQAKEITGPEEQPQLFTLLERRENLTELTKEIVRELVEAVYVYEDARIEVVFRFRDKEMEI